MTSKDKTYGKTETDTNWRIILDVEYLFLPRFSTLCRFVNSQCLGLHTWWFTKKQLKIVFTNQWVVHRLSML